MKQWLPIAVAGLLALAMLALPTAPRFLNEGGSSAERSVVLSVDDSSLERHGLLRFGSQRLKVRLLTGSHRGEEFVAANELRAQMEFDKIFKVGDTALVIVPENVTSDSMLVAKDHWRMGWMLVLFGLFSAFLVWFGGWVGLKALISFAFSAVAVWKVLIPALLRGWNASAVAFGVTALLTVAIMYLVAGFTRKGAAACCGALMGTAASLGMAWLFSMGMHVNGATLPFVQTLLYSGAAGLDLTDVFVGAVVLASSGAVMDLGMDIASAVEEIKRRRPSLGFRELLTSGMRVGRSVVGTMTTTLLLAYSGGYLTLLMVFAAQGTSPIVFMNSTLVSAEVVKTLVGSFGLVLVAPFTAFAAAGFFRLRAMPQNDKIES